MKPVIVLPTYNERQNISRLLDALFALHVPELEVVVVDDNSPDGTAECVAEKSAEYAVHLVSRNKKLGIGSAYISGFKKALSLGADFVFEMDADFSHDPSDVRRLLAESEKADLVIGSRRVPGGKIIGWNWRRHLTSWGANACARIVLGLKTRDVTAGFRCFRHTALEATNFATITSNGYAFQEEILYRAELSGLKIIEIPVIFTDRKHGKSKLSGKDALEFFTTLFRIALKDKR